MKDGEEVCDMKVFDYGTWQMKSVKDVVLKSHHFVESVFPLGVCSSGVNAWLDSESLNSICIS